MLCAYRSFLGTQLKLPDQLQFGRMRLTMKTVSHWYTEATGNSAKRVRTQITVDMQPVIEQLSHTEQGDATQSARMHGALMETMLEHMASANGKLEVISSQFHHSQQRLAEVEAQWQHDN